MAAGILLQVTDVPVASISTNPVSREAMDPALASQILVHNFAFLSYSQGEYIANCFNATIYKEKSLVKDACRGLRELVWGSSTGSKAMTPGKKDLK